VTGEPVRAPAATDNDPTTDRNDPPNQAEDAAVPALAGGERVFVTNVGGAGMSAVATLFAERGHPVAGHDPAATTPFVAPLQALGVDVHTGDDHPALADDVAAVIVSTATPDDAPEVVAARERDIPVLHRKAALAVLCAERTTISVAGTHGKTTTSAMLATILVGTGRAPGWVVGAPIPGLGRSATWGGDGPLVVEADESDGTFLALPTTVAIVTNVEPDHLEHWGGFDPLVGAFRRFLTASEHMVVCADDEIAARLAAETGAVTYGTAANADYRLEDVTSGRDKVTFLLVHDDQTVAKVELNVPGIHNARNATAAIVAAVATGVPVADAARALSGFVGVARRFEHRGQWNGVDFIDSYDHLPSEVAAVLRTAAGGGWNRVVCVFQPHRYSRTASLWATFADAFVDADVVAITDIYAAGEKPRAGVTGKLIVDAVLEAHPWRHLAYLPGLDDVELWLRSTLRPGDVCVTLGAGDLTTLPSRFTGGRDR
jgi:UDP-N-acetylmuramate--alanine ligase